MNRLINLLLIVCILVLFYNQYLYSKTLDNFITSQSSLEPSKLVFHGTRFTVYGLKGAGQVHSSADVYIPIYMADSANEMLRADISRYGSTIQLPSRYGRLKR